MSDFERNSELQGFDSAEPLNEEPAAQPDPVANADLGASASEPADTSAVQTDSEGKIDGEYHFVPPTRPEDAEPVPHSYTPPKSNYTSGYGYVPNGSYNQAPPSHTAYTAQPSSADKPAKPSKPARAKKSFGAGAIIATALIAALVGGSVGVGGYVAAGRLSDTATTESAAETQSSVSTQTISINSSVDSIAEAVAQKCSPSVVGIRTTASVSSFFGNQESTGEGSGVIYTSDGYIITNYHVIEEAAENAGKSSTKIEVYLASDTDTAYAAEIVGYNISYDLAVIKIDATGLSPMDIGDSDALNVGQSVIAIGNPGGLSFMGSVSSGIISGLNRTLSSSGTSTTSNSTTSAEYIQTDAAINPGNSGGALVNAQGQLIGINSVKLVSESYEGMGFAIPVNKVTEICDDIIAHKDAPAPYIGIEISTRYDSTTLKMYGYPSGAVISSVVSGSPADDAGLQRGDIITAFNGTAISEYTEFSTLLNQCTAGDTVDITIYRSGRTYTTTITIGSNG
jgi:serine protease Do